MANEGGNSEAAPAAAPVAEAAPAAAPSFDSLDEALSADETQALMNFDAFAVEEETELPAAAEAEAETPAAEGEVPPEGEGEALEPGNEDDEPPVDEGPTAAAAVENAALLQRIAALEQAKAAPAAPPADPGASADAEPAFAFDIPDQLMELMGSEDPGERKQAVAALSRGIARETYRAAMAQVSEAFKTMPGVVQAAINQQNSSRAVFEDFYGAHGDLNRPELRAVIMETAKGVMAEEAAKQGLQVNQMPWSEDLRDKVAKRAREVLGLKAPPKGKRSTPPKPLPKGGGAAPRAKIGEGNGSKPNSPEDISATLFGS
ncbi:MAG: hypothetical protein BMS9Abin11_1753 [Gammaproteobacteria bacterium]|nr:MAG: hypothetical protein BMS9Abin11_1753 [Gammaproteobacteria bacterium]